jgi:hypothetical protein
MGLILTQQHGFNARRRSATLTSLVQQASANATGTGNPAVTMPTVIAGDIAVWQDRAVNSGSTPPASAVPSGFTQIATSAVNVTAGARLTTAIKRCDGTESGTSLTGMSGTGTNRRQVVTFRGNVPVASISVQDAASEGTDNNPAAQVVNASGQVTPILLIGSYTASSAVDPRGMTPAKDGELQGPTNIQWLAWKFYNVGSTPADVTVDMDDESVDNNLHSCYVLCS